MFRRKYLLAMLLILSFGLFGIRLAYAQQPQPTPSDDQVNAIARQLYCPVCENTPLDVCPTPACAQWRELIRQKLAAGWGDQAVIDYFVQQYGARVLGTPPAKGLNLLVYVIPPVVILASIYVLYRAYRTWKRPIPAGDLSPAAQASPPATNPVQDEYIQRLEDEVRKR